jgi:hypothetical protein
MVLYGHVHLPVSFFISAAVHGHLNQFPFPGTLLFCFHLCFVQFNIFLPATVLYM